MFRTWPARRSLDKHFAAGQSAVQLHGRCRLYGRRHDQPAWSSPDFTRTLNVYDSQGGIQPVTFSFIKTAANTWAYEASYAGSAANLTAAGPIAEGTLAFNSDGTLANVNGAAPASGNFNMTIPWNTATSGLALADHQHQYGRLSAATDGLTQFDTPSTLTAQPSTARPSAASPA